MFRDVEVQNAPTVVADNEEAIESPERDGWYGEEVHRGDCFTMVPQKRKPSLGSFRISWCPTHPTRDGSFGNIKPEHEKLAMNSRRAPSGILGNHLEDQLSHFRRKYSSSNWFSASRNQSPIKTEACAVPAHYGFRSDDNQRVFPPRPNPLCKNPEQFVEQIQPWFGMPTLEHSELLPQRQIFQDAEQKRTSVPNRSLKNRAIGRELYQIQPRGQTLKFAGAQE